MKQKNRDKLLSNARKKIDSNMPKGALYMDSRILEDTAKPSKTGNYTTCNVEYTYNFNGQDYRSTVWAHSTWAKGTVNGIPV